MFDEKFVKNLVKVIAYTCALLLNTLFFKWLWNAAMPEVFGLKELTFGNAICILALVGIIKSHSDVSFTDKK